KFDLAAMMDTVSKLDTNPAPQVKMIPLDDILANKDNFYTVDKASLKPLADSIAMDGLQQYPLVMPHPHEEGKYLLLSGHRRCAAVRMLVEDAEQPREDLRMVPCTVKQYQSAAMAELQLIFANSTARVLTNAEISRQAERMEILLYQLKEEGYEFPGRMRDQVAAACNVSAPKLARLKVIREKLKAPEFVHLFEKNKLPEQTAYALARLPEDFQKRLAGIKADLSGNIAELILRKYEEGWRWEPDMRCPDGKACKRGDAFLRHDLEHYCETCGGKTCCLECGRAKEKYYPCDRMCSKAQALRKEKRDEGKAAEAERVREETRKLQEETQANAKRLLRAVDAAGLPEDTYIDWDGYGGGATVAKLREYAAGTFPEGERWYWPKFSPDNARNSAKAAKLLGCSADYLLGLTDELTPAVPPAKEDAAAAEIVETLPEERSGRDIHPVWLPGSPERSGPVAARFDFSDGNPAAVSLAWYDSARGKYYLDEKSAASIDAECTGWWPVPEEEKPND
ncbi:MAG: ParB N-terminal domain-containing protein, partial [Oscillospiraceae bacterium]|nr:ParB N-terminal domain-containing protein [Oscillospiraceae bacterium]